MAPPSKPPTCAACQKPAALVCNRCKDRPAANCKIDSIYYCSANCQRPHWKIHKTDCRSRNNRLVLVRMASTLQEIFYIYREQMYDKSIIKVEEKNGKIYVTEDVDIPPIVSNHDVIVPLPVGIFDGHTHETKQATLVQLACSETIWMDDLIKYFLNDIVIEIREHTDLVLKNTKKDMVTIDCHGKEHIEYLEYQHEVLQLFTEDGQSYALDLTSAQYGYFEPLVNWNNFCDSRLGKPASSIRPSPSFGERKAHWERIDKYEQSYFGRIGRNNEYISPTLRKAVICWVEQLGKKSIQEIHKLPENEFIIEQKELLRHTGVALNASIEGYRRRCELEISRRGGREKLSKKTIMVHHF